MPIHQGLAEFLEAQRKGLAAMAANLRKSRVAAARRAAVETSARIKSLDGRVRTLARSGLRVTSASHGAVQDLIELQSEIVTSALNDAAAQIERMAYTEGVRDFARVQAGVMQAARQRIVDDITRTVKMLKGAARDVRTAVRVERPAARKTGRRPAKAKRAASKPARRGRQRS